MIRIRGPDHTSRIDDPDVRRIVEERFDQVLNGDEYDPEIHGELIVAEEGDTAEALEEAMGVPVLTNPFDGHRYGHPDFAPACEVIEDHGHCYEMVVVLSDEGTGVILFVPKHTATDPELTAFCAAFAVPAVD